MSVVDFLLKYYLWILVVLILIVITVIGFLADTKRKKNESKIKNTPSNEESPINSQPVATNQNLSPVTPEPLPNITNGIQVTPIKTDSPIATPNIIGATNPITTPTMPTQPVTTSHPEINNLFPNPSSNLTIQSTATASNFSTNQPTPPSPILNSSETQFFSQQSPIPASPQPTIPAAPTPILSQVTPILPNAQFSNPTPQQIYSQPQPNNFSQSIPANPIPQPSAQPQFSTPTQGQVQSNYINNLANANLVSNQNLNQQFQQFQNYK